MNTETLQWAVFCAVLVPLCVLGAGAAGILGAAFCMWLVAIADWIERHG